MQTKRIERVRVFISCDENPDTSCIGEFTDRASDWAIVREEGEYLFNLNAQAAADESNEENEYALPDRGRECRFFLPYAGGEPAGTDDYQKYGRQDWERMEGLQRGDWQFVGIVAEAVVAVRLSDNCWKTDRLTSGGLWGIESDSDSKNIQEFAREQLSELSNVLAQYGFGKQLIGRAVAQAGEPEYK